MQFTVDQSRNMQELLIDGRHVRCDTQGTLLRLIEFCKQSDEEPTTEYELQKALLPFAESLSINAWVLVDGNIVWNVSRLVKDMNKLLNNYKIENFTDYLYKFFSLQCGTIAHYNRHGWWEEYQPASKFLEFVAGLQEKTSTPDWHYTSQLAKEKLSQLAKDLPEQPKDPDENNDDGN